MIVIRFFSVIGVMFLLSSCCNKPDKTVSQNMYLEGITSSSRTSVEAEVETSIIDGTTYPWDQDFSNQSSFSFSDEWASNIFDISYYYGESFFESVPGEQDVFLSFNFSLDKDLLNSSGVITEVSVCGEENILHNALLYQNANPPVEDNLFHKKASLSIPVLIDMGVISDANTSKDLCFVTSGTNLEDYDMCSRNITWQFNEVRVVGEQIIQVLTDLESKGINFDYNN